MMEPSLYHFFEFLMSLQCLVTERIQHALGTVGHHVGVYPDKSVVFRVWLFDLLILVGHKRDNMCQM
jgi:hypothetical protein